MIDETLPKTGHGVIVTGDARGTTSVVPRWGGRVSPKLSEPEGGCVDTERGAYTHDPHVAICRIKPLAVGIAGVPGPMFRLDTSPGWVGIRKMWETFYPSRVGRLLTKPYITS